ncbi:uncharacterized protein Z519_10769 [Cladophialophora bantiana CBS 173.52]|uniref:Uncharacterized protein n=1 Tax=Cladophialophora bantiana (strain ATCC 10958 / CBS 173.52 / CDC B-1940 / NIH 8579) TaxID=1442370 RepID=A0A0D2H5X3_CLAB1|nr:uncharacterized protein Z519_10769 [Cladophialophora bantiana CBS 173.52]KIW88723.1 hypothetical protein Z519_10769 [Cladophialophora bantiana CBS 173.52]
MSRRQLTTSTTYTLAHTAQCKLKLAANRPDRNLRFVLGHAFTLDNLMVRIVEIENQSAKSVFQEGKPPSDHGYEHYDRTAPQPATPEPDPHYDCTAAKPTPSEPEPTRGRRVSFHDNNARPSSTAGVGSNNRYNGTSSPTRKRSPPPVAIEHTYLDEEQDEDDTSSDDYDDPNSYLYDCTAVDAETEKPPLKQRPVHDAYSDEEDAALELADDELDDEMNDLSLTRFESASAKPPRMVRSSSSSSDEEEDNAQPVTPPQLPADVDVREIIGGEKDDELTDLYESVRRCRCHGRREDPEVGGTPQGVWDVPVEKTGGKHLAVVAVAA